MAELIHEHSKRVKSKQGVEYSARTMGVERRDGTWEGWIEFHPASGSGDVFRTGRETSQPSRQTLVYWASGIEPVYLDGALERARRGDAR